LQVIAGVSAAHDWLSNAALYRLLQDFEQILFEVELPARVMQGGTVNQKAVFNTFAKRHDFSGAQVDAMFEKHLRNGMQDARPISGSDVQNPMFAFFIGVQLNRRANRKGTGLART